MRTIGTAVRPAVVALLGITLAMAGCVTKEVYNAQINRATNLQRLLAEEEKRSADLSAEIARLKKQVGDLEVQNKGLNAQLTDTRAQVVRSLEEVGRLQEEVQRARTVVPLPASPKSKFPAVSPAPTEPPDRLGELPGDTSGNKKAKASTRVTGGEPTYLYHEVKRGDTLTNIAGRYKTDVRTLRELNDIAGSDIRVGDRLIVGEKP